MRNADLDPFTKTLDAACGLLSRGTYAPNATSTAIWFRALQRYPLEAVQAAFDAHVRDPQRGRFVPTPADIIAQIEGSAADDGRPGAEEAWATAFRARDERNTVVWTAEMAEAFGVCAPLLDAGDELGARMAFKESYTRIVAEARAERRTPQWTASLGFDAAQRDQALLPHVAAGRIPVDMLAGPAIGLDDVLALPAPEGETEAGRVQREKALARLAELRAEILDKPPAPFLQELERQRTEQLKAEAAAKVAAHQAEVAHGAEH